MILTTIGCLLFSTLSHAFIIPALMFIAFGGGLFTPAIYSLLGSVYSNKQHLREGGFSIYYSSVNIGVFIAMIFLGYLQTQNWRWVFYSFWMAYNQGGSSMTLFALKYTDRHLAGFEIPTPWFTSTETFFLILFAFPLAKLYLFLRRIRSPASPPMKTALSLFFMGLCFLVMQRAAQHIPHGAGDALISPYYLIFSFALMSLAELFLAPIGLSLVTNLSPHRYRGLLTGVWFTCIGIGFYLGGYLAGLMAKISLSSFFDIFVFTSFVPAFILVLFAKKLDNMRHIDSL